VAQAVRRAGNIRVITNGALRVRQGWIIAAGATFVAAIIGSGIAARVPTRVERATEALAVYERGLDQLDAALVGLDAALATGDSMTARDAFRRARRAYKRVELFVEYYGSSTMRELNGAPLPKAEDEDPETPLAPVGLQMVEAALFPGAERAGFEDARRYVPYMRLAVRSLRQAGVDTMPGDAYLFDAMRHELSRVATLGVASFDATLSGDARSESADALDGVRETLRPYHGGRDGTSGMLLSLDSALAATSHRLRDRTAPTLDRLDLIANHLVPAAHRLATIQTALGIGAPSKPRAWSAHAASIYDRDAFDPAFFAATDAPRVAPALVKLGRDLFFDPTLSPSGTRSCGTCHLPERAFTDGLPRAALLAGHRAVRARNTPTLINAALQPVLFADGRVRTLEDQATDVLGSAAEMGGSLAAAAATLSARPADRSRLAPVVGGRTDSAATARAIRLALAAYVRSLVRLDARFDRAVRGDAAALDREERRGFELFMGKGRCGTCHFAPLFGGATPPTLTESEPEVIGVPTARAEHGARIDPDSGRFRIRRIEQHLHAFRTPTLRNVTLTAPYMHNGVFRTLDEVMHFYDVGGGHGIGAILPHQTLPTDSLHLEPTEKRAIIAFLGSLSDTAGTTIRPRAEKR
jgi:cytochrome c peroxidase